MTVPFKKRRIVLPQHTEATPKSVTSSVPADVVQNEISDAASSASKEEEHFPLSSSKYSAAAVLVDTNLDTVTTMTKAQGSVVVARAIMQFIASCESQAEAEQAIRSILQLFMKETQNERRMQILAQTFAQLNAVPIILKAMCQWNKKSLRFASLATDVLKVLLFHVPTARKSFLHHDGIRVLMEACQEHWYLPMIKAALAALSNAASSLTRDAAVIKESLAFVMKVMQIFDGDAEVQRLGSYFYLKLAACNAMSSQRHGTHYAVSSSSKRKFESCNQSDSRR